MPFDEPNGLSLVGDLAEVHKLLRRAQASEVNDDFTEWQEALEQAISILDDEYKRARAAETDFPFTRYDRSRE